MAIAVGITGGIGSGKSSVCRIFKILGIPVFDADNVARVLMDSHPVIVGDLIHLFGKPVYNEDNKLNRKYLAGFVFNDNQMLEKLNEIVHPVVREAYFDWVKIQTTKYVIHEAAILFESGFYRMMDFTILITAPEVQRIERVVQRDGFTVDDVKRRMKSQWEDNRKRELTDYEIVNDNNHLIIPEVLNIDKNIKSYGKIR